MNWNFVLLEFNKNVPNSSINWYRRLKKLGKHMPLFVRMSFKSLEMRLRISTVSSVRAKTDCSNLRSCTSRSWLAVFHLNGSEFPNGDNATWPGKTHVPQFQSPIYVTGHCGRHLRLEQITQTLGSRDFLCHSNWISDAIRSTLDRIQG